MEYFYNPELSDDKNFLGPEESKHCVRVLRHVPGDLIHVLNGKGGRYSCKIISADPLKTTLEVVEKKQSPAKDFAIHIAIAPTKNMDRMEWFVEKSVEIGIDTITFIQCHHSDRKNLNTTRLYKKAVSALKQSGNLCLPEIQGLISFNNFLKQNFNHKQKFIGHAGENRNHFILKVAEPRQHYLILIGPEGDFSSDELKQAYVMGFLPVSLGNSRLRTETAGIVTCSVLQAINS